MEPTPEKDKFLAWFEEEKKKGLMGFDITPSEGFDAVDPEEIYAELNRMIEAPDIPESPDFF